MIAPEEYYAAAAFLRRPAVTARNKRPQQELWNYRPSRMTGRPGGCLLNPGPGGGARLDLEQAGAGLPTAVVTGAVLALGREANERIPATPLSGYA
jgi:hypothetical protein